MSRRKLSAARAADPRLAKKFVSQGLTLDALLAPSATTLDVHSVDVRRLRDDRSPIEVGEEVMFVAAAKFRLESAGVSTVDLEGTDVLEIRDDADLVSKLEIDSEEDIQEELEARFDFIFRVNGVAVEDYQPVADDPPWIFRFNTALYATDYLKIEVDVVDKEVEEPNVPTPDYFDFQLTEAKQRASFFVRLPASAERRNFKLKLVDVDSDEEQELLFELTPHIEAPAEPALPYPGNRK